MTLKKFVSTLSAFTLVLTIACGGGKEASHADEGEDDEVEVATETTVSTTAVAGAAAPAVSADAATIIGMVKFEGAPPAMPAMQMGADAACQMQHKTPVKDEEVVLGANNELANVLVYVKDAPAGPVPSTPALLNQKGCQYIPHVTAVQVGQAINIRNSDATLHNVHAMPEVNKQFNEGQPVQGMTSTKKFDRVEMKPFRVKCDVHGWMKSYMAVLPHSYHGVSGMNGNFTIGNLPPGSYTLVAWHEKYGTQEQQIQVGAKEQKQVAFTFKG